MGKKNVPAISKAAGLAGRAIARLEAAAASVHQSETARRDRSLQLLSSKEHGFQAVIRHGSTTIEIQGNDFAVRQD